MKTKLVASTIFIAGCVAGCSSVSMPSMPSMPSLPWSHPAVKADLSAEELFAEGTRNFNDKRYARAIDAFTKIKTDYPFSPLLTETELKVADAYYLNQQYPEAINALKEFQSLHPSNENLPFVTYRLGQSYFDQFSATDRDQKNTETAKGYFETVINNYPKSSYAAPAKEKLLKCIEYLADYDFSVASFYYQQQKYPAARDRFEEIVRKYRGTPAAAKSLFYLGDSYRKEKNNVKASLAYEALIQHYPQSKYAPEAKTQLAQIENDKQDPLAMLLMRDRRPGALPAEPNQDVASKSKDISNVVAKTDFVYEEPGEDKGFFRRMVDAVNPLAPPSSSPKKSEEKKPETGVELLAKKNAADKQETPGMLASFWGGINPFSSSKPAEPKNNAPANSQLVNQVDDSLKQKGIDTNAQIAALKTPAADLPNVDEFTPRQTMDTEQLIGNIDATLKQRGKSVSDIPPPPEAAEIFNDVAAAQAIVAKAAAKSDPQQQTAVTNSLLSSIDQKLKGQGVDPGKFDLPPAAAEANGTKTATAVTQSSRRVELDSRMPAEKGPLFLNPAAVQTAEKPTSPEETLTDQKKPESSSDVVQESTREVPRSLVKGPSQPVPAVKIADQKKANDDPENMGVIDYLKQDIEGVTKVLNPFRW